MKFGWVVYELYKQWHRTKFITCKMIIFYDKYLSLENTIFFQCYYISTRTYVKKKIFKKFKNVNRLIMSVVL